MELKQYQDILLGMVTDFAAMCRETGIHFYLAGGGSLGAVRHNGFIPWDDDLDIALPRRDYDRLPELVRQYLPDNYELIYRENARIYQLLDRNHPITMVNNNMAMENGTSYFAFIDLFPLDGCPAGERARKRYIRKQKRLRFWYKLCYIQYCHPGGNHSRLENLVIRIARGLHTEKLLARRRPRIGEKWEALVRKYDYETSEWVTASYGIYGIRDTFPRSVVGEGLLLPFENTELPVFENYDRYLTQLYGDYMTPVKMKGKAHLAE